MFELLHIFISNSAYEYVCTPAMLRRKEQKQSPECSVKNVFIEISQNSLENTCARVSFFKNEKKTCFDRL